MGKSRETEKHFKTPVIMGAPHPSAKPVPGTGPVSKEEARKAAQRFNAQGKNK